MGTTGGSRSVDVACRWVVGAGVGSVVVVDVVGRCVVVVVVLSVVVGYKVVVCGG